MFDFKLRPGLLSVRRGGKSEVAAAGGGGAGYRMEEVPLAHAHGARPEAVAAGDNR